MLEDLRKFPEVLAELKANEKTPADLTVAAAVDGFDPNPSTKNIIVVRWRLPDTKELAKRLARHMRGDEETIDPRTGDLIVLLKKKNGTWYWNPFGW